jgi:sporulation protein YunB
MLYRRMKRRPVRPAVHFKPLSRGQRVVLTFIVILSLMFTLISLLLLQIRPLVEKLANTIVTDVILVKINEVIEEEVTNGAFDYNSLVTLDKDGEGNITALKTNMAMINTLQTRISNGLYNKVDDKVVSDLTFPIGNAIGGALFSGRGPSITIKVLSIANVDTNIYSSITPTGINQTRHKINLDISADIDILVPGYTSKTVTVATQVVIAETVIVGTVPNVYADIGELGESGGLS